MMNIVALNKENKRKVFWLKFVSVFFTMSFFFASTTLAADAPTIGSISPANGPSTGGTNVTITGTGFIAGNFGSGLDGSVTISANKNINVDTIAPGRTCGDAINYSISALTVNTATLSAIPDAGCLFVGDEILIINQQGTVSNYVNVGNYETLKIQSISDGLITFTTNKTKYYGDGASDDSNIGITSANQRVMLQRVPNYQDVTINSGYTLTASAWNGTKGGLLYFKANGMVINDGTIEMNGKGFSGGLGGGPGVGDGLGFQGNSYSQNGGRTTASNFGGGGAGAYSEGGAGGGYGTDGFDGLVVAGSPNGIKGISYGSSDVAKLFMGSGAGGGGGRDDACPRAGGMGGSGGGVIVINGKITINNGNISANGLAGGNGAVSCEWGAGGGGGGAGGSIVVNADTVSLGASNMYATGGNGGNPGYSANNGGAGGAGGVGRVAIFYGTSISGAANPAAYSLQQAFHDNPVILFGGSQATVTNVLSPTAIIATTPAHTPGTADVVVTNYDGQSATLTSGYTFNPALTLSAGAISPSSAKLTGGDTITITGTGFYGTPTVTLGGTAATSVTVINSTTITAITPAHNVGQVDVVVTNQDSQSATLTNGFTFTELPPTVSSVSSNNGVASGGTNVTIMGNNFLGGIDSYTKLLLHGDGTGASFVDSEATSKTITANGDVTQTAMQSKFGGKSISFDGAGDYLTISDGEDWNFGSGDFTIDFWMKTNSIANRAILGQWESSGNFWRLASDGSDFFLQTSSGGFWVSCAGSLVGDDTFHHIAIVRNGSVLTLYVDGISKSTQSNASAWPNPSTTLNIGYYGGTLNPYVGYIDEFRVSKGIARWTSNFTPPTTQYYPLAGVTFGGTAATNVFWLNPTLITATTPAHTPGTADVVVTNYDGQSATLTNGYTFNAPPTITTGAVSPSSAKKTGGDTITITGTGFYGTPTVTLGGIAATSVTVVNSTTITAITPAHNLGQVDVVVTNQDSQSATLANGFTFTELPPTVSQISPSSGSTLGGTNVTITGTDFLVGAFDNGTADANTKLFLRADGVGASFVDSSLTPKTVTAGGNVTQTTTGGGISARFDGNGDYLRTAALGLRNADFTVDLFFKPASIGAKHILATTYNLPTQAGTFILSVGTDGKVNISGGVTNVSGTTVLAANNWYHIALVYTASTHTNKIYVNGVLEGTTTGITISTEATYFFLGGSPGDNNQGTFWANGWMDEMRASAGARWTSNFTPPIKPYGDPPAVTFDGVSATNVNLLNSTTLTVNTPAHSSGVVNVSVINPDSQSATLPGAFTYIAPPTIESILPSGAKNTGGDAVTITGTGFYGSPTVTLGGTAATGVIVVNPTTITAITPAHSIGQVDVVVTNEDFQSATLTNGFAFLDPPPSVFSVNPADGAATGGTSISISGANFLSGIDNNVSLSLHNDIVGSSFVDSSLSPKTVNAYGTAAQSSARSKFGGVSAYLNGTSDYIGVPASTDLDMGTGNFTVDFWYYYQDNGKPYPTVLSSGGGWDVGAYSLQVDNQNNAGKVTLHMNSAIPSNPFIASSTTVSANAWHHYAWVRSGNTHTLYVDGVSVGSGTYAGTVNLATGGNMYMGRSPWDGANSFFSGYIDEVRVSKGIARWTSGFTTPSTAYRPSPTVSLGGTAATNVVVVNPSTITATTSAHTSAVVDVLVTNYDGQSATLLNAFEYHNWITRGTYTSSVKSFPTAAYGVINWNASTPVGTAITMRVKSCSTADCSDKPAWTGCDLASNDNGTDISGKGCVVDGQGFVQYQAYLTTDLSSVNPYLDSVTISDQPQYSKLERKMLSSPFDTGDNKNAVSKIAWSASNDTTAGTVQAQIRTAPDNGSGAPDWTNSVWCGPTDCSATPNSTNAFAASYYNDKTGATAINIANRDSSGDRWIQYATFLKSSDGASTPTLSDVSVSYVVNAPPQLRNVAAVQESDGIITVAYDVRDPDTSTGATADKVDISLEYCSANCANAGSEIWTLAQNVSGDVGGDVDAEEVNWSSGYQIRWNAKLDYPNQYNNSDFKVRVRANDSEGANNIATASASLPIFDTKNPALGSVALIVNASTNPAIATLSATDDSGLEMKVSTSPTLSGANWEAYSSSKNITLSSTPSTIYAQFKDAYGNTTSIINATTPEMPTSVMVQDVSNLTVTPVESRLFIAWKVAVSPGPGFGSYEIYRSEDQVNWSLLNSISDRLTNYFADFTVDADQDYYYRVKTVDVNNNVSAYSAIANGKANGTQDAGEGGGVAQVPPVISNVTVDQITNVSARINWTTDTLSTSTVGYSTTAGSFVQETGSGSMVTSHSVIVGNLSPSTKYYFQVKSIDALNGLAVDSNGVSGYDFTTVTGDTTAPVISAINVGALTPSTATITWTTDENANSFIEYSKINNFTNGALFGDYTLTTSHSVMVPSLEADATYYFKVHSKDASNNESVSTQQTFITPPSGDVTLPVITDIASTPSFSAAAISWTTDESATSYVEYGTTTAYGNIFGSGNFTTDHNVQLPSDLVSNTTYHFRVHSTDGSQNEAISNDNAFTTTVSPDDVSAPLLSDITIGSPTTSTVAITWNTNENSTSFVGYSYDGGNTFAQQGSGVLGTAHSVTLVGLTPGTSYLLKVISEDDSGNIAVGDNGGAYYSAVTLQGPQPPVLSNVTASGITFDEATITWNSSIAATSFVEYGLDASYGQASGNYDAVANHSIRLKNLLPNQTYHFRVRSINQVEAVSGDYTFSTQAAPDSTPPVVSDISANPNINTAQITWTTNEVATSYVEYGTDTNYGNIFGNNTLTTNHSVQLPADLNSDTTYHYRIRTADALGNLTVSTDNMTTTTVDTSDNTAPNVSNVNITSVSPTTITATWNTNENASSYVAYSIDGITFKEQGSAALTQNHSVTLVGLAPEVAYELQIKSADAFGNVAVDDNGGANYSQVTQSLPNAPVISNVSSTAGAQGVTITWTTDINSDSQVEYGADTNYGTTAGVNGDTKNHSVTISGLNSSALYHFRVHSIAETEGVSGDYTFITIAAPDSTSPVVTNIVATPAINTAQISWTTNEAATSYVEYGLDTNYGNIFGSNILTTNHSVQLPADLSANTVYHFRIRSADALENLTVSDDDTFNTLVNPSDEIAPIISNLNISSSSPTTITATWNTDEASTSYIAYSVDGVTFKEQGSASTTQNHSVTLVGLSPSVNYQLKIKAADNFGNVVVDDNGGANYTQITESLPNAPVISNINVNENIDGQSVTITWITDVSSDSQIEYGPDANYGTIFGTQSDTISHSVTIKNLIPSALYHFRVRSTSDVEGVSADQTFTTMPPPDASAPIISGITSSSVTDASATITWNTNKNTDSILHYGATENYNKIAGDKDDSINTHSVKLENLDPNTTYHYQIVATDDFGNITESVDQTFTTIDSMIGPEISDLEVLGILQNSAVISWKTDKRASTAIHYGTSHDLGNSFDAQIFSDVHFILLAGLEMGQTYYFKAISEDGYGNSVESAEQSFNTAADPSLNHEPLSAINEISTTFLTDTKAVISFKTDQAAQCFVEYGIQTDNYTEVPVGESTFETEHAIHIAGLVFATPYFYQLTCQDNLDTIISSEEKTFTTLEKQVGESQIEQSDRTAPIISNMRVTSVGSENAVIEWDTDEDASSSIRFGTTSSYGKMTSDDALNLDSTKYTKTHTVNLERLVPGTKYYYVALSLDGVGNVSQSSQGTFTTSGTSNISSVVVESTEIGKATIAWFTEVPTSTILEYGVSTKYGSVAEDSNLTQNHQVTLSNLKAGSVYHFLIKGEDDNNNLYVSADTTFEPKSPPKIKDIQALHITEHSATIEFTTNVPTSAAVTFQDSRKDNAAQTKGHPDLVTKHSIELTDLVSGLVFMYTVSVRDENGTEVVSEQKSFTTGKDTVEPLIDQVKTDTALTQNDKVQAIISWKTDEPAMTYLTYRKGKDGEEKEVGVSEILAQQHVSVVTTFEAGTVYYFKVKAIDAADNESVSNEFALLTPRRKENIIQVIIANFYDIFRWAKR